MFGANPERAKLDPKIGYPSLRSFPVGTCVQLNYLKTSDSSHRYPARIIEHIQTPQIDNPQVRVKHVDDSSDFKGFLVSGRMAAIELSRFL